MDNLKQCYYELKDIWKNISKKVDWTYVSMIFLVFVGYVLAHDLIGETFKAHNHWDSYTLQAKAWLDGKVGLGQNYEHLELAIYKGDWFVSFPPFPSVAMLPWVLIYGTETPNNIIMIIYVLIALTLAYRITKHFKMRDILSAFWSIVVVLGCNICWMSTMGGVWFQAQLLNMILLLGAILAMLKDKRVISYICIALAVGCRPFSIIYFFVIMVYYYIKDSKTYVNKKDEIGEVSNNDSKINNKDDIAIDVDNTIYKDIEVEKNTDSKSDTVKTEKLNYVVRFKILLKQWPGLVAAAIIGICYMAYNYVRFDNPLEFGHNYLPEFLESPEGQFNISYVAFNLYRIFGRQVHLNFNMGLQFDKFDGFNVFVANPIFSILLVCIILNVLKKNINAINITIVITLIANVLCLCMHKTLGGWQFGNRYLVDLIPFIMLYILLTKERFNKINKVAHWERVVAGFAVMFNIYGIIFIYLDQLMQRGIR